MLQLRMGLCGSVGAVRRPTRWLAAALAALLLAPPVAAQAPAPPGGANLPVSRVAISVSGVGYFEREGRVAGDAELLLNVRRSEMDDLLASLVVQEFGGGTVEPIRYSIKAPVLRLLSEFSFDISGNPTLLGLLRELQGEAVTLEGADVSGALLGVEEERGDGGEVRAFVTLATPVGLRRVPLTDVRQVRLESEALNAELTRALEAVAANRNDENATLRLAFSGEGERTVRVAYVREMPAWKASYRLVIGEDGGTLQGWAIIDNPTNEELSDVTLSLVAGQPAAFLPELYEPRFVKRDPLTTSPSPRSAAQRGDAAARAFGAAEEAAPEFLRAAPPAAPQLSGAGVEPTAVAGRGVSNFAYTLEERVTIGANESAMVPIVTTSLPGRRLSLFDSTAGRSNPLAAFNFRNESGLQLPAGVVTLFDEHGFAGNAPLPELVPSEEATVAFALDPAVTVEEVRSSRGVAATRARLIGGVLEVTELTRQSVTYRVDHSASEGRTLLIDGPHLADFEVKSPPRTVELPNGRPRIEVALLSESGAAPGEGDAHYSCAWGESCAVTLELERVERQSVTLSNLSTGHLQHYLTNVELTEGDRELLSRLGALHAALEGVERKLVDLEERARSFSEDQSRIRSNMAELAKESPLYQRYVEELAAQEDMLAELKEERERLRAGREELRTELSELLTAE